MIDRNEVVIALEQGLILESEDEKRYVVEENMCGGKYGCWINDDLYGHQICKLTNNIEEAIEFVS